MVVESIPHNLLNSQSPSIKLDTIQKLPSSGFIKVDLKEAWVHFIKRYEPFTCYVTLTFKEPKHPESFEEILNNEGTEGWRYIETVIQTGGGTALRFLVVLEREVE